MLTAIILRMVPETFLENFMDYGFDHSYSGGFTQLVYEEVSRIDPSLVDAVGDKLFRL